MDEKTSILLLFQAFGMHELRGEMLILKMFRIPQHRARGGCEHL